MPFSATSATRSRTGAGTAGFCSTRATKPLVSAAISTAPISAVPSEAPRFWAVPWRPPASFVLLGIDRRHDHVAELGQQQPGPDAEQRERDREPGLVQLDVDRPEQEHRRDDERQQAGLGDALGREARGEPAGPSIAATNIVTDIGNSRLPVSNASRPRTTCR